jgi:hypothetical protein
MKVLIENLIEKIELEDAQKSLDAMDLIIEKIPTDDDLAAEITDPATITKLHQLLIDHLGVAPRAMQLTRRFSNTGTRAIMFSRAMRNGIAHVVKKNVV